MTVFRGMFKHQLPGLLFIAVLALPFTAWTGEDAYYGSAGGGFSYYTGDIDEKTNLDFAADFELSLGHYFANSFAHEIVAGYLHDGHDTNDIRIYSLSLAVMRMFPVGSKLDFFLGGGFGAFYSEFEGYILGIKTKDEDFRPGLKLLTGFEIDTDSGVFTRFQFSYRLINELQFEDKALDPSGISATIRFGYQF